MKIYIPGASISFACICHRFINSSCFKNMGLDGMSLHDLAIIFSGTEAPEQTVD